jgi:hypothetical protein
LIVWSIVGVVLAFVAYWIGEVCTPRGFDGPRLAYLALAVLIPLFVYLFSVGHMAVVGGDTAAGGDAAATAAGTSPSTPAVCGMSGPTDATKD